jgi:hypothetical protein
MAITKFSYEVDPWNSDLPCYLHLTSPHYSGTEDAFTVPASPNYPHLLSGTPSRYFLKTSYIIDVSALTGARPCTLYDSTSAVTLTRVTGVPSTNQYRIVTDLSSKRRSVIEFHSGQAGHTIDYDMYIIGGLLEETDWNDIRLDVDNLIIDQDDQFSQTGLYSSLVIPANITTYKVKALCYCGNNIIAFIKESDDRIYTKSILDIDNETAITTYPVHAVGNMGRLVYIGSNNICYLSEPNRYIQKKSILDVDNATALSTVACGAVYAYCGNDIIVVKTDSVNYLRSKLITDVDNFTTITSDFIPSPASYVGGNKIVYGGVASANLYIKNYNDTNNGSLVSTLNTAGVPAIGVGNNKFIYRADADDKYYIKSMLEQDNASIVLDLNSTNVRYIGNGKIMYTDSSDEKLYTISLKDFV